MLPLLNAAGWKIDRIQWDAPTARDRRIALTAKSESGKQVHLTCPEEYVAVRLSALLGSK